MGEASSSSDSSSQVITTTQTYTDSFNTTVNRVNNLSNAGNVNVTYPGLGDDGAGLGQILPVVAVGCAAIVAVVMFRR